ncbi:hypothetical protein EVAR_88034_1 [Eumeta japonica]|uniref:THAP-type domain-containing protein n=1 Tax=Eumeta variegata TaxID=151549 RepID=A0A4C1VES4_EUMVA|nr:hypothetical protein EVAR_88034_1 [Eumeta japonica]
MASRWAWWGKLASAPRQSSDGVAWDSTPTKVSNFSTESSENAVVRGQMVHQRRQQPSQVHGDHFSSGNNALFSSVAHFLVTIAPELEARSDTPSASFRSSKWTLDSRSRRMEWYGMGIDNDTFPIFSFPKKSCRRESWVRAVRLERRDPEWRPFGNARVCSMHFDEGDFYVSERGKRLLKKAVVPVCTMVGVKREPVPPTENRREVFVTRDKQHEKPPTRDFDTSFISAGYKVLLGCEREPSGCPPGLHPRPRPRPRTINGGGGWSTTENTYLSVFLFNPQPGF